MATASLMQTNFNAGVFSPLLEGFIDTPKRGHAVRSAYNLISLKQGPLARRGGTMFAARAKNSALVTRVIGFEYSADQAYMIETGQNYFRFFRGNASVFNAMQNITNITKANPAVVTYSGADNFPNGMEIYIENVAGMTQVNNKRYLVANVNTGANTFELHDLDGNNVNSTSYSTYTSGGDIYGVYEKASPYLNADIRKLRSLQSADVLYLVHPSYKPRALVRQANNNWDLNTLTLNDGPYLAINITATTLTPSGGTYTPGTTVPVTASSTVGINGGDGFQATDVGRLLRIKTGSNWAWGEIVSRTSTTLIGVLVKGTINFPSSAILDWRLGSWSDTTGWPSCAAFLQDRIVLAGGPDAPIGKTVINNRVEFSETGGYSATDLYFEPSNPTAGVVAADNAISVVLNSRKVSAIRWVASNERGLQVGTTGSEWIISSSANSVTLTPEDANAYQIGSNGSADVEPLQVSWATLFPQRAARKLLQLAYTFDSDTYKTPDLTILSENITRTGIVELAYQQEPQNIVWGSLNNGYLTGCTYYPDENIVGWHPHIIGGYSDAGHTVNALVQSIDVIPAADGSRDELWMVVERWIDGGTKKYIEYMTRFYEDDVGAEYAVHVDSALMYDGAPVTRLTGFEHLEGETLTLLVDGGGHPEVEVVDGAIDLVREGSVVVGGLSNKWQLEFLRPEGGSQNGVSQGKTKRIFKIIPRLYNSLGLKYGPSFDKLDEESFAYFTTIGIPHKLKTGDLPIEFHGDYETDGNVCMENEGPFPFQIQALIYQLEVEDAI